MASRSTKEIESPVESTPWQLTWMGPTSSASATRCPPWHQRLSCSPSISERHPRYRTWRRKVSFICVCELSSILNHLLIALTDDHFSVFTYYSSFLYDAIVLSFSPSSWLCWTVFPFPQVERVGMVGFSPRLELFAQIHSVSSNLSWMSFPVQSNVHKSQLSYISICCLESPLTIYRCRNMLCAWFETS